MSATEEPGRLASELSAGLGREEEFPARLVAYTPSGPVPCCVAHAQKLAALMGMLGARVVLQPVGPGLRCVNCENEATAERPNVPHERGGHQV